MVQPLDRRRLTTFSLFAVAFAFVTFVSNDVPLLRHDWFPIVPGFSFAIANVTGWDPTGFGSPISFPASFVAVFARSAVAAAFGAFVAHVAWFLTVGLLVSFGAARLASVLGAPLVARPAAALFAAFNPWTYVQLVAGHSFLLISYAATFWLIAEVCSRERDLRRLVPLALAIAPQIQFLLVDAVLYVALAIEMRSWLATAAILGMLLPVVVGVSLGHHALLQIPSTFTWEAGQSIFPLEGVVLRGYFTHYDSALPALLAWAMWLIVAIAIGGVAIILGRRRREAWLVAYAAVPLVWSFGTRGPASEIFTFALRHVRELALFRELFDLLGFVAIGYVAFCAVLAARVRIVGVIWVLAGMALPISWTFAPPSGFWVGARGVPVVAVPHATNARFAMSPAFGPFVEGGRGSGGDPDLYARPGNITPLNEALALYPAVSALGRYERDGDVSALAALSVRSVISRPWLHTDPSVAGQVALPLPHGFGSVIRPSRDIPNALPELGLAPLPQLATLATDLAASNILFADARAAFGDDVPRAWAREPPALPVEADTTFVRASKAWVNVSLTFAEAPELAQSYGGAITTDPIARLRVVPGYALVFVRGLLIDQTGRRLVESSGGYRWIAIPARTRTVRCLGTCVVAVERSGPTNAPLDSPARPLRDVPFVAFAPWFVTAAVPPGRERLLRYNVAYDPHWVAFVNSRPLTHVVIDGAINGWLLAPRANSTTAVLVETSALAITCAEAIGIVVALVAIVIALRSGRVGAKRGRRYDDGERAQSNVSV